MAAASLKEGYEYFKDTKSGLIAPLSNEQVWTLILGNAVAFVVALIAIKTFISFLTKHGFKVFGWYRIAIVANESEQVYVDNLRVEPDGAARIFHVMGTKHSLNAEGVRSVNVFSSSSRIT